MTSKPGTATATGTGNNHDAQAGAVTWIWDAAHQVYYSPESGMYAYPDQTTGQWHYMPASSFASTSTSAAAPAIQGEEKEEGEIEDDVGWGGLMEPEELDRALKGRAVGVGSGPTATPRYNAAEKHPAYGGGGSTSSARPRSPSPSSVTKDTPKHLLRLVVLSSPSLTPGQVAVIDAREGGIQLGRDRCEKGGHPRVRVREMEVSKSHAVVYWGMGQDEDQAESWFVVDLGESPSWARRRSATNKLTRRKGSTHGTFVTPPSGDIDGDPLTTGKPQADSQAQGQRLSEPKVSSLPYPLTHLSVLSLGKTRFEVHLHPSWPCDRCQLGKGNEIPIDTGETTSAEPTSQRNGNGYAMNSQEKRENREVKRKREMAELKNSLLNRNTHQPTRDDPQQQQQNRYIDRSAIRRQMHPRSPPPTRAQLPPEPEPTYDRTPAGVSTFAQNMLAAQGWAPGSGLGRDQAGRSEAIEVRMRVEKRGLGAQGGEASIPRPGGEEGNEDWRKRAKMRRFEQMR